MADGHLSEPTSFFANHGNALYTVRTQCKVLYVGKYSNPSFGPLGEHLMWHALSVCGGVEILPCGPPKHPQFPPQGPLF